MSEQRVEKEEKRIQDSYSYFALKSPDEIYYLMASIFKACKGMGKNNEWRNHPHWSRFDSAGAVRLSLQAGKSPGQKPDMAHFFLDNLVKS